MFTNSKIYGEMSHIYKKHFFEYFEDRDILTFFAQFSSKDILISLFITHEN